MDIRTFGRLADLLDRWATDFAQEEYRKKRVQRVGNMLQQERLYRDSIHVRLLTDRVVPIGEGLEAWLLDLWLLLPRPSVNLSHALQILVVPEGLKMLPLPQDKYPLSPVYDERNKTMTSVLSQAMVPLVPHVRFQAIASDGVSDFCGRPCFGSLPWNAHTSVRIFPRPKRKHLLAQLLLLGIRQGGDMKFHRWLVEYGNRGVPREVHEFVPAAVNHAITHYLIPSGNLGRYLTKVAIGMAQMGNPPADILEEAFRLKVSPRTVYRWRSLYSEARPEDEVLSRCEERAGQLREKRLRTELARLVAQRKRTTYDAIRKRIKRRLAKGKTLPEVAREFLPADGLDGREEIQSDKVICLRTGN